MAERQERGAANDGKEPLCPRGDRTQGLVPDEPAPTHGRSARPAVYGTRRSLCLLRHHGELPAAAAVSSAGHEDVAQVVGTSPALEAAHMGSLHDLPRPPPAATLQHRPPTTPPTRT